MSATVWRRPTSRRPYVSTGWRRRSGVSSTTSPIGYRPDAVPRAFRWVIQFNPIYYMTEVYRDSMLYGRRPTASVAVVYVVMCVATFALGSAFFERFKGVLADYE